MVKQVYEIIEHLNMNVSRNHSAQMIITNSYQKEYVVEILHCKWNRSSSDGGMMIGRGDQKNMPQCHFVQWRFHMGWHGIESGFGFLDFFHSLIFETTEHNVLGADPAPKMLHSVFLEYQTVNRAYRYDLGVFESSKHVIHHSFIGHCFTLCFGLLFFLLLVGWD
jgi:hypothetical protein